MFRELVFRRSLAALAGLSVVVASSVASANTVTLELKQGGLQIDGRLISSDAKSYVLETQDMGRITVSTEKFACVAGACPEEGSTASLPPSSGVNQTIRVEGSATVGASLFPQLIRDYADTIGAQLQQFYKDESSVQFKLERTGGAPSLGIDLKISNSTRGFAALAEGNAEIGMASRPINDTEVGLLTQAGFAAFGNPNSQHVIGMDGITVIVSLDNPITTLSLEEISAIFSGEITDWSHFGAPAGEIELYALESDQDSTQIFEDLVVKPYKRTMSSDVKRYNTGEALAIAVADDPQGIGFASIRSAEPASMVNIRDTCGLVHKPSNFTVLSGEYPISRNLYFYTGDLADDARSDLVRFASSADGDRAVEKAGFVSKSVRVLPFDFFRAQIASSLTTSPQDLDVALLRQLMLELEGGFRLSTTLRFQPASIELQRESSEALDRLVAYLKTQDLAGRKILLAGYSDTSGAMDQNRDLSLQRANAARDILLNASGGAITPDQVSVNGYGELFPIACNDTAQGRERNRRVEVWIVPQTGDPSVLTRQPT